MIEGEGFDDSFSAGHVDIAGKVQGWVMLRKGRGSKRRQPLFLFLFILSSRPNAGAWGERIKRKRKEKEFSSG
jgi:hypothetical protein